MMTKLFTYETRVSNKQFFSYYRVCAGDVDEAETCFKAFVDEHCSRAADDEYQMAVDHFESLLDDERESEKEPNHDDFDYKISDCEEVESDMMTPRGEVQHFDSGSNG